MVSNLVNSKRLGLSLGSSSSSKGTSTPREKAKSIATIGIIATAMMIIVAAPTISQPALAAKQKYEQITGTGTGTLTCSNGNTYPDTSISFSAIVPVVKSSGQTGPAQSGSSMTLTNAEGLQTQGTILAGGWMVDGSPKRTQGSSYTLSGTTTTDDICGIAGSPFTISGIIGPEVQIILGGKYDMTATGSVTAQGWHPME